MRYVIHAGVHKTGTSTLQHFLADNAAVLMERGVFYPVGFFRNYRRQHSALAVALRQGDRDLVSAFFTHCLSTATSSGATTTIISGEEISTLTVTLLKQLRDDLLAIDPDADIAVILYYRNLYDLAISRMQQAAKRNRRVFDSRKDKRMIARMDPTQQIQNFERVYGEQNVQVGIFDTAIRGPGLERDLLDLAGIEWTDELVPSDSRNVSMDLISTTFLNMLGYEYALDASLWRTYAKVTPESYVMPTLRNDMVDGMRDAVSQIDVSHPKLKNAYDVLTEVKRAPSDRRPDIVEFLTSFESLVRGIRTSLDDKAAGVEEVDEDDDDDSD